MAKAIPSEADRLAAEELENNPGAPKGHATPTRKEREAARKRPLVGGKTPEARRMSKSQAQAQRERARVGMQNGEERYLPTKDRGPQKRYVRDYVDARYSIGELAIPLLVLLLAGQFFGQAIVEILTLALYGYLLIVIVDVVLLGIRLNKLLAAKFGADRVEKIRIYSAMRSIQFRLLRMPKPQVKRGAFPS